MCVCVCVCVYVCVCVSVCVKVNPLRAAHPALGDEGLLLYGS